MYSFRSAVVALPILWLCISCTTLPEAFEKHDFEKARDLMKAGADPNARDKKGNPLLFHAITNGEKDLVMLMVEKGADVNCTTAGTGQTPLMWTATLSFGGREIANYLIEKGAKIDAADRKGQTALIWASHYGSEEIVRLLLEKGADASLQTMNGDSALKTARKAKIAALLCGDGSAADRMHVLSLACGEGDIEIMRRYFPSDPVSEKTNLAVLWQTIMDAYKKNGDSRLLETGKFLCDRKVPEIAGFRFDSRTDVFWGVNHKTVFGQNVTRKDLKLSVYSDLWFRILNPEALWDERKLKDSLDCGREFVFLWKSGVKNTSEDILMHVAVTEYFDKSVKETLSKAGTRTDSAKMRKNHEAILSLHRKLLELWDEDLLGIEKANKSK